MTVPPSPAPKPRGSFAWPSAWALAALAGRALLTVGVLLLGFAAFQLWGTGQHEARAQEELSARLAERLTTPPARTAPPPSGPDPVRALPDDAPLVGPPPGEGDTAAPGPADRTGPATPPPEIGEPFAAIRIPAIGVDKTVVEGTGREELRSGPGHYRGTAMPGHAGNVAIAGHRTTYGAPFHDIDQLVPGDEIVLETVDGVFTYRVEDQADEGGAPVGHRIVTPDQVEVIADRGDSRVTLTACHPLYSARQRIIVTAVLVGPAPEPSTDPEPASLDVAAPAANDSTPAEPTAAGASTAPVSDGAETDRTPTGQLAETGTDRTPAGPAAGPGSAAVLRAGAEAPAGPAADIDRPVMALEDDLGWQTRHLGSTIGWAGITAAIAAAAWLVGRCWRRWPAYALAGPSLTLALLTCFGHLDRLIPAA